MRLHVENDQASITGTLAEMKEVLAELGKLVAMADEHKAKGLSSVHAWVRQPHKAERDHVIGWTFGITPDAPAEGSVDAGG